MLANFQLQPKNPKSSMEIIILSRIQSKLVYVCSYSFRVGKLCLVPSHPNGLPIKFSPLLLNDVLNPTFQIGLKAKGFKIVETGGYLEFINKIQAVVYSNQVYLEGIQKLRSYVKRMPIKFIDQFVLSLLQLQSKQRNTPKLQRKSQNYIKAYSHSLQTRRKMCQIQKAVDKSALSPRFVDLEGEIEGFINFLSGKQENKPIKLGSNLNLITEIEVNQQHIGKRIMGGVSIIEQRNITQMKYTKGLTSQKEIINSTKMVIKKMRVYSPEQQKKKNIRRRFYREPMLIQHLTSNAPKQYLLNYYFQPNDLGLSFYYIEYAEMNLTQFLSLYRSELGYSDLLDICLDIIKIIKDLHLCGVVHRDIKPDNFLVSKPKHSSKFLIKIIDFSDAFLISHITYSSQTLPEEQQVCGTIPYSPIETERSSKRYYEDGINKLEIDLWSVGILLHIIIFGYQPVSFSRNFWKEINELWMKDFTINIQQKKGHNISLIDETIQLIFASLVQMRPEKRMGLAKVEKLLLELKKYYNNLMALQKSETLVEL